MGHPRRESSGGTVFGTFGFKAWKRTWWVCVWGVRTLVLFETRGPASNRTRLVDHSIFATSISTTHGRGSSRPACCQPKRPGSVEAAAGISRAETNPGGGAQEVLKSCISSDQLVFCPPVRSTERVLPHFGRPTGCWAWDPLVLSRSAGGRRVSLKIVDLAFGNVHLGPHSETSESPVRSTVNCQRWVRDVDSRLSALFQLSNIDLGK